MMELEATWDGRDYRGQFGYPTVGQMRKWSEDDADIDLNQLYEVGASVYGFDSFDDVPLPLAMLFLKQWAEELKSSGEGKARRIRSGTRSASKAKRRSGSAA